MNTNADNSDNLIARELTQAVTAFTPPAGLKDRIREHIQNEQKSSRGRSAPLLRVLVPAAAAAVALIAASIWLFPANGSSSAAYAGLITALESTQEAKHVHWRASIDLEGVRGQHEVWISIGPLRILNKLPSGVVQSIEGDCMRTYDPLEKTIKIEDASSTVSPEAKSITSFAEAVAGQIEDARKAGHRVTEARKPGLIIYTIHRHEAEDRYYVDASTGRFVRTEEHSGWAPGHVYVREFDYPSTVPADIYALGVPREAKITELAEAIPSIMPATARAMSPFEIHFAEIMAAVKDSETADWAHIKITGGMTGELWISVKPLRQAVIQETRIQYLDGGHAALHIYDPAENTLTVQREILGEHFAKLQEAGSIRGLVMSALQHQGDLHQAQMTQSRQEADGRQYDIFTLNEEYEDEGTTAESKAEVYVDVDTNRVERLVLTGDRLTQPYTMQFDYPETGPLDIYALGVPQDAKIVDLTGQEGQRPR